MQTPDLPPPACRLGYTRAQVRDIIDNAKRFRDFMVGQTMAICQGEDCVEPHGVVVYGCDIRQYLSGRPPLD